jgi:predicted DNA-binding protein with PD1-like motif
MGTVPRGADLVGFLDQFVRAKGIRSGVIGAIGVVEKARLGFLDLQSGSYVVTEVSSHREIAGCVGNVSIRADGLPGIHAHIVVSDPDGTTTGGHLLDGTTVHYVEFWITPLEGEPFKRTFDPGTKVTGWA